eukprot:4739625-Amphidinium_carterae.1
MVDCHTHKKPSSPHCLKQYIVALSSNYLTEQPLITEVCCTLCIASTKLIACIAVGSYACIASIEQRKVLNRAVQACNSE